MNTILLIGIGGAIGTILRYILGGVIQSSFAGFHFGTLIINFTGVCVFIIRSSHSHRGGWTQEKINRVKAELAMIIKDGLITEERVSIVFVGRKKKPSGEAVEKPLILLNVF